MRIEKPTCTVDFSEIVGQEHAKRALEVAAVGGSNVLMAGPPGAGKSMLARAYAEFFSGGAMEVSIGDTVASLRKRAEVEKPGLIVADDFPELRRDVMFYLRELAENVPIVATMHPCPCGHQGDPRQSCSCTTGQIIRYKNRIPGSIVEMFDILIEVPPVHRHDIISRYRGEITEKVWERIMEARRFHETSKGDTALGEDSSSLLKTAVDRLGISMGAVTKIRRLARYIADLEGVEKIEPHHLSEAIQYRMPR